MKSLGGFATMTASAASSQVGAAIGAHAFATNSTASELAWAIVERRIVLDHDGWHGDVGREGGAT